MQRYHLHSPNWIRHIHKPDWHSIGLHLDHLVHNPLFWALLALAILFALMVVTMLFTGPGDYTGRIPMYPYAP